MDLRPQKHPFWYKAGFILLALAAGAPGPAQAQPSGGPYGPIPQRYEIPKGAAHVYYVSPDGQPDAPGTAVERPTTLEAAISRVVTGDAIILRGGTYRTGGLRLNQGITLQPYADERPILKGTLPATKWEAQSNGLWRAAWPKLFPSKPADWWRRHREGRITPLHRFNNDMVFVDGEMLQSAGWEGEVDERSYSIDYDAGQVYIGVDPAKRLVEITAFDSALIRTTATAHGKASDRQGPLIRGITFTQYAYRALEFEGTEPEGPRADPARLRQGRRGHHAGARDHHLLLPRGRILPRRPAHHPPLPDQRHQHRGRLRDRLLGRAAGEEHLPAQQRGAASPATTRRR